MARQSFYSSPAGISSEAIRKKGFDLPGVYYRHFRFPLEPEPLWTLRLSLDYPLVISAIFPLLWLNQVLRAPRKRAEGDGGSIGLLLSEFEEGQKHTRQRTL
jgi:hypothetical protein